MSEAHQPSKQQCFQNSIVCCWDFSLQKNAVEKTRKALSLTEFFFPQELVTWARPPAAGVPLPKNNFATWCEVAGIAKVSLCIYTDLKGVRVRQSLGFIS